MSSPIRSSLRSRVNGLAPVAFQSPINIFDYGYDPQASVDRPMFHGPVDKGNAEGFVANQFDQNVLAQLEKFGIPTKQSDPLFSAGYWLGIRFLDNGQIEGGVSNLTGIPSYAEGY